MKLCSVFSDTWQLIINTGTTVVTFLMVFLIQNTQNRDNRALHAKLDELIVHTVDAHNKLAMTEDFSEDELKDTKEHFKKVGSKGGDETVDGTNPQSAATRSGRIAEGRTRTPGVKGKR